MIKQNKNKLKRPLALLLVCVLLAGVAIPAHALLTETPDASGSPTVRVISTLTDGGQYLEVGLNIDSKEDGKFQSVGALLKYDPDMLTPVQWDEPATAINVPESSEAAKTWSEAELLPAKGADELNGKVAAAAKSEAIGYLYLSAESARVKNGFVQPLPIEAGDETTLPALSDRTTQGLPISAIAKAETPSQQAVVVRFKVNEKSPADVGNETTEGETQPELYSLADLAAALDIVDPTADESTTLSFPLADKSGLTYIADNTSVSSAGQTTPANLEFLWVQEGVTVNSGTGGGTDLSTVATFTCFDATGEYLGALSVARDSEPEDVVNALETFAKGIYRDFVTQAEAKINPLLTATLPTAADSEPTYYKGDLLEGAPTGSTSYYDYSGTQWPLSYKKGYNFAGWTQVTGDISDMYTTVSSQAELDALLMDLTTTPEDGWQSMTLMAAYVGDNTLSKDISGVANERYSLFATNYNKYGADSYSIQITVQRENADGRGSTRLRDPALRITATVGGETVYMAVKIDNVDQATGEVVLPRGAESAAVMLVDFAEVSDWTAASRKLPEDIQYNKTEKDAYDFLYNGTISYICESAVLSLSGNTSQWGLITGLVLNDVALDYSNEAQPDFSSTNANFLLNNAKNKLLLAFAGTGKTSMTQTELQAAISMEAGTVRTSTQYSNALAKVQAALEYSLEHQGRALTIAEVALAAKGEYTMS